MNNWNGYVSYREAKQSLDARLKTTEEEIALWVSGVDGYRLDAYMIGTFGTIIKFSENGGLPFGQGNMDYISPLEGLYFKPDEIEQFQPTQRYIAWNALIKRWEKYCCYDTDKTKNLINCKSKNANLLEHHPVLGGIYSSNDKGFERGLFNLDTVETIELELERTSKSIVLQAKTMEGNGESNETPGERQSQLYILIWRVYQFLSKEHKTKAQQVWDEIQHRHEQHDTDEIIQEVTAKEILWCSSYGNEQKLKRSSFDKTLSNIRKDPPV